MFCRWNIYFQDTFADRTVVLLVMKYLRADIVCSGRFDDVCACRVREKILRPVDKWPKTEYKITYSVKTVSLKLERSTVLTNLSIRRINTEKNENDLKLRHYDIIGFRSGLSAFFYFSKTYFFFFFYHKSIWWMANWNGDNNDDSH